MKGETYKATTAEVLKTHESRKTNRKDWDNVNDEIAYYVLPSQTGFLTDFVPGERTRWSWRYDSTAGYANKKLANHLHMSMVSPSKPWFEVQLKDKVLGQESEVKKWLEDTTEKMYLALGESNFNAQINTLFQGFCAFGTACMDVNFAIPVGGTFTLLFKSTDLGKCTFDYNGFYQIDTKVEEFDFTPRQANELFGDQEFVTSSALDGNDKTVKVLKITRPNPDYDPDSLAANKRMYMIEWCQNGEVFEKDSAYEQPFMMVRFSEVKQDNIYGEGPALLALSDIRSINRLKRLELRAVEKAVDPPLMTTMNGILSDLDIEAGGLTVVRNPREIGELPGHMKQDIVMYKSEDLRASILATYSINDIEVPERRGQNPLTATEIQVRQEQAQKMLGAAVGRIKDELLTPMLVRVFGLMYRNGMLLPIPEELSGLDIDIAFIGPLAKAQNADDGVAIERAIQTSMAMAQITGKPSKVINYDAAERILYDRYGVPAEALRSVDEVEALEAQERQAAEEAKAQQDQMNQAAVGEQEAKADSANVELLQNVRNM